jgi:MFS family permease
MDSPTVKRFLPWVVALALFMEQLDSTIVNTAVPSMAASLHVTPLSLKAVVASYILSLAVCIPVSGWIADRYGTRRVFAIAIAVFTISSVFCGLAMNLPQMVAARILQGIGAAMMMPVGRLTVIRTFPKAELLQAMNFIIPALIGPLLGPTVGGLIVHWFSWREIFFVNVPAGVVALWLIHRYMPDYYGDASHPLDVIGLAQFGAGTAVLSWLLEIFGEHENDGEVALSKCGPATRDRVARENCPHRRLENAGSGPPDDTAQRRWRRPRRFGGAWRRTPGSLCLPDRIFSLLAKPARSKRLYLWPVRREFYSPGTGGY